MADTEFTTGFERLLRILDPAGGDGAGAKYEALRRRLIRFFDWRGQTDADELADVVFDRLVKKVDAGEEIANVEAYAATVAQFVLKEALRRVSKRTDSLDEHPEIVDVAVTPVAETSSDQRFVCLDRCLANFDIPTRRLLLAYHDTDERTMIASRRRLAESLGISINTLRIRICRHKSKLEECVRGCCAD